MIYAEPLFRTAGDSAILIEWADEISDDVNDRVHAFAQLLRDQARTEITDLIPAYSTLLVNYNPLKITYQQFTAYLYSLLQSSIDHHPPEPRLIEIPVTYGGEFGPDLEFIAQHNGIAEEDVIQLHSNTTYRVYFVGFTHGFAYLGSISEKIAAPRLQTPRTRVPTGSVGIAGRQTGVYPAETPGGWRLIGRTTLRMFDPNRDPPTLLQPGDRVRFVRT